MGLSQLKESPAYQVCLNKLLFCFINYRSVGGRGEDVVNKGTHLAPQNKPIKVQQLL